MAEDSTTDATSVQISTDAAEKFVDAYYTALQGSRHTIADYYVNYQTLPDGKVIPKIVWNGNQISDGPAMQTYFENEMPYTNYDVRVLNAHILNPTAGNPPPADAKEAERNISIVVMVSGDIRLEDRVKGPLRGFSETFVLIPNSKELAGKGKKGHGWVIQTQNFRYIV